MSEEYLDLWIDELIDTIVRHIKQELAASVVSLLSGTHTQDAVRYSSTKRKIHRMLKEALGSFEPHDINAELHHHDM